MRKLRHRPFLGTILALALTSACGAAPERVRFTSEWPTKASNYEDTAIRWTRQGVLRAPLSQQASQLMEVYATYLSTEWRAAYVNRQARLQKLSETRTEELATQQQEVAKTHHELQLLVTTYYSQHNDLHRERSIWRVILIDGNGNEVAAESVERDRRPREVISADFENFGDFAEAYTVRFPHTPALLTGESFSLRVSSSLGMIELDWVAQK